MAKPDRARRVGDGQPAVRQLVDEHELPRRWIRCARHRQVDRTAGRRQVRPREPGPRCDAEVGMALVERPRPAGDLDQRAGPDGESRVDPPHERHRLVPDVGQAMAGSDERLAGAELHPALDPERRDDPRAAQLDGDHVRTIGRDPARPGLRPHLAQERELLAADHRRMTRRDDLVDPARPPVVRVRAEDGRSGRRAADGGTAGHDRRPSTRTPRSWPRAWGAPSSGRGRSRARWPGTRGRSTHR